jgi:hypothetical protein
MAIVPGHDENGVCIQAPQIEMFRTRVTILAYGRHAAAPARF